MPDELVDELMPAFPGIDHPVVVAHPVTGTPGIFVNRVIHVPYGHPPIGG